MPERILRGEMELVDILLDQLGITGENEREILRQEFSEVVFERFLLKLSEQLTPLEFQTVKNFLQRHNEQDRQAFWQLLFDPAIQEVIAATFFEEAKALINDPAVVAEPNQSQTMASFEAALAQAA